MNPACNYYFMFVSTFIIAVLGTWVTEKLVVPRLGEYTGDEKPEEIRKSTPAEKRGLVRRGQHGVVHGVHPGRPAAGGRLPARPRDAHGAAIPS